MLTSLDPVIFSILHMVSVQSWAKPAAHTLGFIIPYNLTCSNPFCASLNEETTLWASDKTGSLKAS